MKASIGDRVSLFVLFCLLGSWGRCTADGLPEVSAVRDALRRAGTYWAASVASNGGYVWEYSSDLRTRRRGESGDLPASTVWVQAATPMVGETFLLCYEATKEDHFLEAALAAGHCLAWGQLASGGWDYRIEFDLKRNRSRYHHLEPAEGLRDTSTFDDDNTQSATRFLMHLDQHVDDAQIDAAVERALGLFLRAQYGDGPWDGAWPQRFPPPEGYGRLPTFNDHTMSDCVKTVLQAHRQYGDPKWLGSVERALAFYLRSQRPLPQAGWAQQYGPDLEPAWARKFEPPAVSSAESRGNCMLLMDMYLEFGRPEYLNAVGRCIDWYSVSRIGGTEENGVWARFYEPETNRPLYFTKTYELTYDDGDLPVHYSFQGNYGVNSMIRRYRSLVDRGRARVLAERDTAGTTEQALQEKAERVRQTVAELDEQGRWLERVPRTEQVRDDKGRVRRIVDEDHMLEMLYTRTFVRNMRLLADYLRQHGA